MAGNQVKNAQSVNGAIASANVRSAVVFATPRGWITSEIGTKRTFRGGLTNVRSLSAGSTGRRANIAVRP